MNQTASHTPSAQGSIEIVVVGAHLSGMILNGELQALSARFVKASATSADYRLYALNGTVPPKPGLLRVREGEGARIAVEVWSLSPAVFGEFVAAIPAPLSIGTLRLEDGSQVKGVLVEAVATEGATDSSHHGGWPAYIATRA